LRGRVGVREATGDDFGNFQPATVSGVKFHDENGDGDLGNDRLFGGAGKDRVVGGAGKDKEQQ
jgi:Ca2+-binding RTX toxin-like protein